MTVNEIYNFMSEHFPYFKNAPNQGWKNSVRHTLSLNLFFQKIGPAIKILNGVPVQRKGCLWALKPEKSKNINAEFEKNFKKDPQKLKIKRGMAMPHCLPALERGEMKKDYNAITDSEEEEDPKTPIEKTIRVRSSLHLPASKSREDQEDPHTPIEGILPKK